MISRWEYRVTELDRAFGLGSAQERLNIMGNDGWELICIEDGVAYLKRPKLYDDNKYKIQAIIGEVPVYKE